MSYDDDQRGWRDANYRLAEKHAKEKKSMSNYELTDAGMVTSDPQIAVLFLGKKVTAVFDVPYYDLPLESISSDKEERFGVDTDYVNEITIPRSLVLLAIWPIAPVFCWNLRYSDQSKPAYDPWNAGSSAAIAVNAITIGKTVGELRELIVWADEETFGSETTTHPDKEPK